MYGLFSLNESGDDKESLLELLRRLDMVTEVFSCFGEDVSILVFRENDASGDPLYTCNSLKEGRGIEKKTVRVKKKNDYCSHMFFEKAQDTGVVFFLPLKEGCRWFCMNRTAMRALCGKLHLFAQAADGANYYRNMYIAEMLLSDYKGKQKREGRTLLDNLVFTTREIFENRGMYLITGVVTDRYSTCDLSTVYKMISAFLE